MVYLEHNFEIRLYVLVNVQPKNNSKLSVELDQYCVANIVST